MKNVKKNSNKTNLKISNLLAHSKRFSVHCGQSQSKSTNNTATAGTSVKCLESQFVFKIPLGTYQS